MADSHASHYYTIPKKHDVYENMEFENDAYANLRPETLHKPLAGKALPAGGVIIGILSVGVLLSAVITAVICLLIIAPQHRNDQLCARTNKTGSDLGGSQHFRDDKVEVYGEGRSEIPPHFDCDHPSFYINGYPVHSGTKKRGWNFVVIDRLYLQVITSKNFDTYGDPPLDDSVREFVKTEIPENSIVLGAAWDTVITRGRSVYHASYYADLVLLLSAHSSNLSQVTFRDSFAFIGYKGHECGQRPSWIAEERCIYNGSTSDPALAHVTAEIPSPSCR